MMNRKEYNPSFAVVYLDNQSIQFLDQNFKIELWEEFTNRLSKVFPEIPIHINSNTSLLQKLNSTSLKNRIILHEDVSKEYDFLLRLGKLLPESKFKDPDWDEVCFLYFTGISPLLDTELTEKAWNRHKNFFSQYSYSENLPPGLTPTIITREFLTSLPDVLTTDIHSFFIKNINQYDVDIFYKAPDLRQLRLDFRLSSFRSLTLIQGLLPFGKDLTYENLLSILKENPQLFRSGPTYLEWEIYKGCELKCTFCPREFVDLENDGSFVSLEDVKSTIHKLNSELLSPITISLTGNGEPLLHPDFKNVVLEILKLKTLSELIIETALYRNTESLLSLIESLNPSEKEKLCVIVNVTTLQPDVYKSLYGKSELEKVLGTIDLLSQSLPNQSLHVQMIKMKEVEEEIDPYFTFFEKKGINVILQKYNTFANKLIERRVSDLTPIHRDFCWHLARDLSVSVDGKVAICKQNQSEVVGNLYKESLGVVWQKGLEFFKHSFHGEHDKIPAPCLNCDEWYTFNA
ncbi:spiro-SPASM protein [Leptospira sp. 2 VSF19]|uniref:Spiro-SPASM protein n=1 Tax=Leptospira soteropolitanensis TaxID=2950025 RepID=A0AAW5VGK0_9LEPT|nr:spiro-SPASM protein [Leptospira soteropolitanensis]MCW7491735.1 spiro-SPASM protein [Leptospira soteropolitanensis]MCW7499320.1 spiro-SPASM protein [Leptospira soteropolitanensis]MCW7521089.1 spiro-SPASM protein [Leptospira soteropolitanensis]MCW7525423.1 spiro-SPASM protein [Leptospira soteropolitanensis]MCW7529290.1 spiro-SPASM protein [Leptospira soteropolitanensis]